METLFALKPGPQTSIPLRPCAFGPRSWSAALPEQGVVAVGLVPSTMTPLRSMPRRWIPGVETHTPDGQLGTE